MTQVKGLTTLQRTMAAAAVALARGPAMDRAVRMTADAMAANVRAATPRRTGRLAASMRPAPDDDRHVAMVATPVPYAAPNEYGTDANLGRRGGHYITPRRMLRTGAKRSVPRARATATAAVQQIIRRVRGA